MRKLCALLFILIFLSSSIVSAQSVGINGNGAAPDASAMLDVNSQSKGFLAPRMTLAQKTAIVNPATGLIIYQTNGTPGIYINQGTPAVPNWTLLASANSVWALTGNAGTTSANFIGTTDEQPLAFRVYNLSAGFIHPTSENTAFGIWALVSNTTGVLNTAIGMGALSANNTGNYNTAIGVAALQANTTGSLNTATGNQALLSNTEGTYNAAHGNQALYQNTTGTYNTAMGSVALSSNTSGFHNTALGSFADVTAPNLINATAVGYNAKVSQSNSMVLGDNVSVGIGTSAPAASSILELSSNSRGLLIPRMSTTDRNAIASPATGLLVYDNSLNSFYYHNGSTWTQVGATALSSAWQLNGNSGTNPTTQFIGTTDAQPLLFRVNNIAAGQIQAANSNTGFGLGTLANATGDRNSATGYHALYSNTTGNNNAAFGTESLYSNTTGLYNSAFGAAALYANTTGENNTATGGGALNANTTGNENTATGHAALLVNITGSWNTANGSAALLVNTTGAANTATGYSALRTNTTGSLNTANGYEALYSNTTGTQNIGIGYQALYSNTTGYSNTATGHQALYSNTTGFLNSANGYFALHSNTGGQYNTANGDAALGNNTTGSYNSANGATAAFFNSTGSYNTASGFEALYNTTASQYNTAIGYRAGKLHDNGYNNVFLGANTDVSGDDFYNCIAIGQAVVCTDVNQAIIGNSATTKWGFGVVPAAGRALQVGTSTANGNGAYLTAGGTWTSTSSIEFKDDFTNLDKGEILDKISSLNISRWHYKGTDNEYHIGPIAEEFYKAFNVGTDDKHISSIDPSGVALAGIQQLIKEKEEFKQTMKQLQKDSQLKQTIIEKQSDELKKLKEQVEVLTKAVENLSTNK